MDIEQLTGCCGAYVLSEFDVYEFGDENGKFDRSEALDDLRSLYRNETGKLIMLTLIDQQLREGWLSVVQELGFRRVARWVNNNHGNVCNLYVLQNKCTAPPKYQGKGKGKRK